MHSARIWLAASALVLMAQSASASETFPATIQKKYSLAAAPPCTICHRDLTGGEGTAIKPFALALKSRGLVEANVASLRTALDALEGEKSDVDHDGVTDIDAIKAGLDPNANAGSFDGGPKYGCGASVANGPVSNEPAALGAALAVVLGMVFSLRRRGGRSR